MNTRNAKRCLLVGVAAAVVALAVTGNDAMALTGLNLPGSVWSYQSREKTKLQGSRADRSRSTGVFMFLDDEWVAADRDHDGKVFVTRGAYSVDGKRITLHHDAASIALLERVHENRILEERGEIVDVRITSLRTVLVLRGSRFRVKGKMRMRAEVSGSSGTRRLKSRDRFRALR